MAQAPKKEEVAAEAPKSKKKLIIIIAIVALLAAGGGGAFYMMQQKEAAAAAKAKAKHAKHAEGDEAHAEEGDEEHEEEAEEGEEEEAEASGGHGEAGAGPAFLAFETFTVNLLPDPDEKFLQLDLTVEVKDAALADKMKAHMPALRNRVLMLLTSKKASDISTPEGKTALSEELLTELKKPFKGKKPLKVKQVLFTSFVIQ